MKILNGAVKFIPPDDSYLIERFWDGKNHIILKVLNSNLHLLRAMTGLSSTTGEGDTDKSSKLMMKREISSTSLFTGAITSLQRNLEPENNIVLR